MIFQTNYTINLTPAKMGSHLDRILLIDIIPLNLWSSFY